MPKMILRGASIRFVDLRYNEDASRSYVRLEMKADFSDTIADQMGWNALAFIQELPAAAQKAIAAFVAEHGQIRWMEAANLTLAKLKGKINATNISLIPNGSELKQHAIDLEANEVRAFRLQRLLDKEGNTKSLELWFQVAISQRGGGGMVENYLDIIGKGVAQLKIGYQKQEDLDLQSEAEDDAQERLISEAQAADTAEEGEVGPAVMRPPTDIDHRRARQNRPGARRGGAAADEEPEPVVQ